MCCLCQEYCITTFWQSFCCAAGTLCARCELALESRSNCDASRLVDSQMTCSAFFGIQTQRHETSRNRDDLHFPKIQLAVSLCVTHLCINDSTMIYYRATLNIAGTCEMNLLPRSLGHMRHPNVVIPKATFT